MKTSEYMTVDEAAKLWKVRPERVTYTCEHDGIKGAAKLSGEWIIPTGTPRPVIRQIPHPQKTSATQRNRTDMQQAIIESFKDGAIPFGVFKHRIGTTTFIVTTCFSKNAKKTAAEAIFSMILRDPEVNIHCDEYIRIMKEFRQKEIERQPSYDEYLNHAQDYLVKMGFNEEDISLLMDKHAESYRPLEEH